MATGNWEFTVNNLKKATEVATAKQKKIAQFAGVELDPKLPKIVVAEILKHSLKEELLIDNNYSVSSGAKGLIKKPLFAYQ